MSAEGTLVYVSGGLGSANRVVWASRETRANSQVEIPSGTYFDVRLSPDGSRAALSAVEGGSRDIWVHDFARTTFTKLSFAGEGTAMSPVWSPDGKYIYYSWITNGGRLTTVMKRPADGSREAQAVVAVGDRVYLDYISRDETWAIVDKVHNATTADVVRISLLVKAPPTPIVSTRFDEYAGGVSPDGRWLAYQSDETGRYEVYVRGLSGDTGRWQVSTSGGEEPRWAPSGRELYFRRDATLLAVPVELAPTFKSGAAQPVVEGIYNFRSDTGISYDVDPKGGRFLMLRPAVDTKSPPGIRAIFNWPAEVERIVGRK
jgi:Tol biopolymer transport system component